MLMEKGCKNMFNREVMTVGDWLVFIFLMAVPFVNIILWIVLLFSSGTNRSLKNFLVAQLLIGVIVFILFMFFGAAMISFLEYIPR